MTDTKKKIQFAVRLDEELNDKLEKFAKNLRMTKTTVITQMIMKLEEIWPAFFSGQGVNKPQTPDKEVLRNLLKEELGTYNPGDRRNKDRRKTKVPINFPDRRTTKRRAR